MRYRQVHFKPTTDDAIAKAGRRRPGRPYRSEQAYKWVRGISCFWLATGLAILLVAGMDWFDHPLGDLDLGVYRRFIPVALFIGLIYTIIPLGLLFRQKWAWAGGLLISFLFMAAVPIGTILGIITLRALYASRKEFGQP